MKKWCLLLAGLLTGSVFAAGSGPIVATAFGARGDGVADDYSAIQAAVGALREQGGGELYFPSGTYRIATSAKAAILLDGISHVTLRFAPGAVLLMDNLQKDGAGGGHGVVVRGPATDIRLENVHVCWKTKASRRSNGDAFRFEGFPSDEGTISRIYLSGCIGENSAQTGAVFMGCSDVFVRDFSPVDTWADGLHFNACRRVNVNGVRGIGNGDDTLAFVTYYSEKFEGKTGTVFSFPALNEWSNSDSNAVNVSSVGGRANGMRISGGLGINVSNVSVSGKWCGVQLDSARRTTESRAVGWGYPASRNINLSNLSIRDCRMGLIVRSLNLPPGTPESDWRFGLNISNLSVSNISEFGMDIQGVAGVTVSNVRSDSPVRLRNLRGEVILTNVLQRGAEFRVVGVQGEKTGGFYPNMELREAEIASPSEVENGNLRISGLELDGAPFVVDRFAGLKVGDARFGGEVKISTSHDVAFRDSAFVRAPEIVNSERIEQDGKALK